MQLETEPQGDPAQLFASLVVAGQDYCIDIARVRENRRWSPTTRLPHAPPFMLGTMNLRGEVVPIIDMARFFGFDAIEPTDRHVIVIVEYGNRIIGLAAEAVSRILETDESQIKPAPAMADAEGGSCIRGLVTTDTGIIGIIDVADVIAAMEGTTN